MKKKLPVLLLTLGIFSLAAFFRLYKVNWDQNQHLHPDERFLTMVAGAVSWPEDLEQYLDASISPLNPHNRGFGFFVYGTFPIFFTKWAAELVNKSDYNGITIVGRQLSAIFDLGTVVLVFLIGKEILRNNPINTNKYQLSNKWKNGKKGRIGLLGYWVIGLLSMFLYSIMVLPIQLSHFFAVDTYLTFFLTLSFYILIKIITFHDFHTPNSKFEYRNSKQILESPSGLPRMTSFWQVTKERVQNLFLFRASDFGFRIYPVLLGIAFGLAVASKISAVYFLPIMAFGLIIWLLRNRNLFLFFVICSLLSVVCYMTVRLAQPYLFANGNIFDTALNQKVTDNWKQLESFNDKSGGFPPAVQWITTKPYIFPLKNMLLWGMGLPMGIISMLAVSYYVLRIMYYVWKKKIYLILNTEYLILNLSLLFILIIFIYQGGQFSKAMRYFYPIYPFLAIISGHFIFQIIHKLKIGLLGYWVIGLLVIVYPLSFLSIYIHPNSRIQASYWIYNNIPSGATLSSEEWDDGLPMSLENNIHEKYKSVQFPLYWPDTKEKWNKVVGDLDKTDYVILSSNRLYGSIMTYSQKYPVTVKFYNALFDGSLGFEKAAEFTSRPNIPFPFIKLCLTPPLVRYGIVALKTQECPLSGISFVDDYADETFTVYDHPKVIIFRKVKKVDYYEAFNHHPGL